MKQLEPVLNELLSLPNVFRKDYYNKLCEYEKNYDIGTDGDYYIPRTVKYKVLDRTDTEKMSN